MLTVHQAAEVLGLAPSTVRQFCHNGLLPAEKHGRSWAITRKALDKFKRTPRHQPGNPNFKAAKTPAAD